MNANKNAFIQKAVKKHGDKYFYDKIEFVNVNTKVEIVCKIHGSFWQLPRAHISKQKRNGCPACSIEMKNHNTIEKFYKKAERKHGNKYEYIEFMFDNGTIPKEGPRVKISCPLHGLFIQDLHSHAAGSGCPHCSNNARGLDAFLKRAKRIHGDKYDYSHVAYKNAHTKINIVCKTHGSFLQFPCDHIGGKSGCPKCSHIISKKERYWLNIIGIPNDALHRQVRIKLIDGSQIRVDGFVPETNTIYEFFGDIWHGNLNVYTPDYVNRKSKKTIKHLNDITMNKINVIKSSGFNLIFIWENEFDKKYKDYKKASISL